MSAAAATRTAALAAAGTRQLLEEGTDPRVANSRVWQRAERGTVAIEYARALADQHQRWALESEQVARVAQKFG